MLFNSFEYAIFLPIIFGLYWFVTNKSLRLQNILLLGASYYFYSCWDYRFLFLLIFSTLLDYFSGIKMEEANTSGKKKFWFWLSICINLGFLGVFKYYNFFADSMASALGAAGIKTNFWTLNILLPVGISFYTFHGLSYVVDIYKSRIKAERNFVDYAVFVSFFPLLVAGPIERATHLLPQIKKERHFDYQKAIDGLRQILWGLFKKIVIADNCAEYVSQIFGNSAHLSGSTIFIGGAFFTLQVYGDFGGYSDIALGTARLFGIELLRNFAYPYFSRDIAEYWRRWHISLTTWFRDYLYIPLGGSRGGLGMKIRNTFIIFLVSGFWHGANWTFVCWGFINACYFLPLMLSNSNRDNLEIVAKGKALPSLRDTFAIIRTFVLIVLGLIVFRSNNMTHAISNLRKVFSLSFFSMPQLDAGVIPITALLIFFFTIEWMGREQEYAIARYGFSWPKIVRWSFYYVLAALIFVYAGPKQEFIYFQF